MHIHLFIFINKRGAKHCNLIKKIGDSTDQNIIKMTKLNQIIITYLIIQLQFIL